MAGLKFHKKSAIPLTVLGLVSIYLTLYTVAAYNVANYVYDTEVITVWRSGPSGSFFPWPREPGMLQILSGVNEVDLFIYICLIKSWILVLVTVLFWVNTFLCIVNLVRYVDFHVVSATAGINGGLFFTLLSSLYITKPLLWVLK